MNAGNLAKRDNEDEHKEREQSSIPPGVEADIEKDSAMATSGESACQDEAVSVLEKELSHAEAEHVDGSSEAQEVSEPVSITVQQEEEEVEGIEDVHSEEDIVFELCDENSKEKGKFHSDYPLVSSPKSLFTDVRDPLMTHASLKLQSNEELSGSQHLPASVTHTEKSAPEEKEHCEEIKFKVDSVIRRTENTSSPQDSHLEFSFPPPAKKTCSTSRACAVFLWIWFATISPRTHS